MDLGRRKEDNVGFVTAMGPSLEDVEITLTPRTRGLHDAIRNIGDELMRMAKEVAPDLLVILKDSRFHSIEQRGLALPYERLGTNVLAIEVLKSGGLSGFGSTRRGGRGVRPVMPQGTAVITPSGEVHLFPHQTKLESGIWSSIRYSVATAIPGDKMIYSPDDVALLGAALSSTGSYHISPERTKYPDLLGKAHKAASLLEDGALDEIGKMSFSARLIE